MVVRSNISYALKLLTHLHGNFRFPFAEGCTSWDSKQWGLVIPSHLLGGLLHSCTCTENHDVLCSFWWCCLYGTRFLSVLSLPSWWIWWFGNIVSSLNSCLVTFSSKYMFIPYFHSSKTPVFWLPFEFKYVSWFCLQIANTTYKFNEYLIKSCRRVVPSKICARAVLEASMC